MSERVVRVEWWRRASLWMELERLGLVLGIVMAGLIAGGREQLLKLDLFPALIAVFLLGFGSDRIKNAFAERPFAPRVEGRSRNACFNRYFVKSPFSDHCRRLDLRWYRFPLCRERLDPTHDARWA